MIRHGLSAADEEAHLEEEIAGMRFPPFPTIPGLLEIFRGWFRVYKLLMLIMTADVFSI